MIEWIETKEQMPADPSFGLMLYCKLTTHGVDSEPEDHEDDDFAIELGYFKNGQFYVCNNGDYNCGGYGEDYAATATHWAKLLPPTK